MQPHQRRNGVADDAELMGAGDGELEPVGEALHAGGFAGGERAVLLGVDEHQPIFAQVGHDGGAGAVAVLPGVAVGEGGFFVRELELYATLHRGGGAFAFF